MIWVALALAAPTRVAQTWTVASPGEWAYGEGYVAIIGDGLTLLDLGTWETTAYAVCESPKGVTTGTWDEADAVWVGCGDGSVERLNIGSGEVTALTVTDSQVTGLEFDGDYLYVVSKGDSGLSNLTAITPDGTESSSYPTTLSRDELKDTLLLNNDLYVLHGGDEISRVSVSTAVVNIATEYTGADYVSATATSSGLVYLADATGGDIWNFDTGDNGYSLLVLDVGDAVSSVCLDEANAWAAVSADDGLALLDWENGSFGEETARLEAVGTQDRLLCIETGALGLATEASALSFFTEAPWVSISEAPTTAADTAVLTFSSDVAGDWEAWIGEDLASAESVATGTVSEGVSAEVTLTVDSSWVEGENRVWITVTDDAGRIGHDAADITVDTPPDAPAVSVGFGESTVSVSIASDDTEDLETYTIYVSASAFSQADYATGGPSFEEGEVVGPVDIGATPGEATSLTLYPLTNGQTYWVAVRAIDAGGQESPMSAVLSATPTYTYSASELVGDEGGVTCGFGVGVGWIGAALAGVAALRRRPVSTGN